MPCVLGGSYFSLTLCSLFREFEEAVGSHGKQAAVHAHAMSPLRATKTGLTVCVALGVFLFLYLWVPSPEEASQAPTLPAVADCGFYPDELCSALFIGKLAAPQVASFCQSPQGWDIAGHLRAPRNCSRISRGLHFITRPLSAEEANFSLAYVLTVPKELAALVRLLRAIYVPQNVYCVHMGDEATEKYQAAVQSLVGCFENIFISPRSELEASGGSARLRADLDCLRELVLSRVPWNYAINLGGEDFPLRTNREIIRYLRSQWNEKNITPGAVQPPPMTPDANQSQPEPVAGGGIYVSPNKRFGTEPPHNLTIYFGSADYVLTRKFVQFVLSDPRAKALLHWSRDIQSPEHHYWVTLNRLRGKNGAQQEGSPKQKGACKQRSL